jgi:RNA polymerase sigma factor (sigma-70 family)
MATASPPADRGGPTGQVQSHLVWLWRYLRMHGADRELADDLAQESFLIALQKGALAADPAALATFLRRTARFLFLRAKRPHRDAVQFADAVDALWQRDCSDGGSALLAAVRACVDLLDGRARAAVELSYGLGDRDPTSRTAIAHQLGMQETGVKTLLQRVRQKLRECIEKRRER